MQMSDLDYARVLQNQLYIMCQLLMDADPPRVLPKNLKHTLMASLQVYMVTKFHIMHPCMHDAHVKDGMGCLCLLLKPNTQSN